MIDGRARPPSSPLDQWKCVEDRVVRVHAIGKEVGSQRLPGDLLHALAFLARPLAEQPIFVVCQRGLDKFHGACNMDHVVYQAPLRGSGRTGKFQSPAGPDEPTGIVASPGGPWRPLPDVVRLIPQNDRLRYDLHEHPISSHLEIGEEP